MEEPDHRTYTSSDLEGEAAVGRLAIWAAWLELELAELVSILFGGVNGAGQILTSDLMASRLIDLSRKLLKNESANIPQALQDRTSTALTEASVALGQRNRILHGTVGSTFTPGFTAFYSRKSPRPGTPAIHNAAELDAMGARLHAAMEEVVECRWAIEVHMNGR